MAVELFRDRQVSNVGRAFWNWASHLPPQLQSPLGDQSPSPGLLFSWRSRSFLPLNRAWYRLFLYELDEDDDPQFVALSGAPPFRVIETGQTSYFYGPSEVPLTPGKRYAWRVQATDWQGETHFELDGWSEEGSFKILGPPCLAPKPTVYVQPPSAVELVWDPMPEVQRYEIQVQKENEVKTFSTDVPRWVLRQQNPGDYTFRVQSVCGIGRVSAWTRWQPYTIPEEEEEESWISDPDLVYSVEPEPEPYIPDPIEDAKSDLARILDAPFEFLIVPAGSDCVGCEDTAHGREDKAQGLILPVLSEATTVEQLEAIVKPLKPQCAGVVSDFSCGSTEEIPVYSGPIISVRAGDEVMMNTMKLQIVEIDAQGNGIGTVKVPMFGMAKVGLKLVNLKVAEGGCVVDGYAETSSDVPLLVLDEKLRKNLQQIAVASDVISSLGKAYASEIAKGLNKTIQAISDIGKQIAEQKNKIIQQLQSAKPEDIPSLLEECDVLQTQTQQWQDSLQRIICLAEIGKITTDLDKAKQDAQANLTFIHQLGKTLTECQNIPFTPWQPTPCSGPCKEEEFQIYTLNPQCLDDLKKTFQVPSLAAHTLAFQNVPWTQDPITTAALRDALQFGGPYQNAKGMRKGDVVDYNWTTWKGIYILQYQGETYWLADGHYYTLGTCVSQNDPSTARLAFKKCIQPNPDGTCNYQCVDLEAGESLGTQTADLITESFTKTLEVGLIAYTAPTVALAATEVSLDLFAEYLTSQKPDWSLGTTAVIAGFNVFLEIRYGKGLEPQTTQALAKTLDESLYFNSFQKNTQKFLSSWKTAYQNAKSKVAAWGRGVQGAGEWLDDLDLLFGAGTKTKVNNWINNGLNPSKLEFAFANSTDIAGLLNRLETSKSIYHQRVHIQDWDNIPGIAKSNLSYNGLSVGKTYSAWNNSALDLPLDEAKNFVNATAVELPAGTKIYRVTGGNPSGAYWTIQKPNSVGEVIGGTAVQPAWNDFSKMYVYEVPQGQTLKVWQGTTARQPIDVGILNPHLPGGDQQLFIPQILRDNNFSNAVTQIPLPW